MTNKIIPIVAYNTFYCSWHEAMKSTLTAEQYGKLTLALNEYCFYGIEPELEGIENGLFIAFKANIDASTRNKLNGKQGGNEGKGGAPKGNQNAKKKQNNSSLLKKQYPPVDINNSNINVEEKENVEEKKEIKEKSETHTIGECESLFLTYWEKYNDVFINPYKIEDVRWWNNYWDNYQWKLEELEHAIENLIYAVKGGYYESKYISPYPDRFLRSGILETRGLNDFEWYRPSCGKAVGL